MSVGGKRGFLFRDSKIWAFVNVMLLPVAAWVGYEELSATRLQETNPDAVYVFC